MDINEQKQFSQEVITYGLRWLEFNKQGTLVTRQKFFKTEAAREKFIGKLEDKDNFYSVESTSEQ